MGTNNVLLNHFGVNNHKELVEFLQKNPNDERTKDLIEILKYYSEHLHDEENI